MKTIISLIIICSTTLAYGQSEWWKKNKQEVEKTNQETTVDTQAVAPSYREPTEFKPGHVRVVKSSSIDKLIEFKKATIPPYTGPVSDGYRVQVFFDQSRKEVDKARTKLMELEKDTPTYIEYKAPNYLLFLGDYRTKLEAEKASSKLLNEFPAAIIKDARIYMPKVE